MTDRVQLLINSQVVYDNNAPILPPVDVQPAPTPVNYNAIVIAAYRDILHREPDPSGLAYWMSRLAEGSTTVSQMHTYFRSQAPVMIPALLLPEYPLGNVMYAGDLTDRLGGHPINSWYVPSHTTLAYKYVIPQESRMLSFRCIPLSGQGSPTRTGLAKSLGAFPFDYEPKDLGSPWNENLNCLIEIHTDKLKAMGLTEVWLYDTLVGESGATGRAAQVN